MLRGDFEAAWEVCDRVLSERIASGVKCHTWPRHQQFIWDGQPIDNKRVLVRCYHGLGDTLQFVRLLAPLRMRAKHVTLWAQPPLLAVLEDVDGVDALLPLHDGIPDAEYDVDTELMEIPHILQMRSSDLPGRMPYLHVAPTDIATGPEQKRVGIAWRSGDWNESRSIPDSLLEQFAQLKGIRWFSLQYGVQAPAFMTDIAYKDIRELAARMLNLDLVISVDTMIAHLSGALALPTWTLLPRRCDWRWMRDREDSPWYPTMRLIRQTRDGDWDEVMKRASAMLGRWAVGGWGL